MRHTFFLSVFRHFFFLFKPTHANKYRKLTSLFFFVFFFSEILGICYASCVCSARTYVYLFKFVADPNARTVRSLSLPYLLSFFFSARSVLPLDHHTVTSHYKL